MYADRLAELAVALGFDGWLVYGLLYLYALHLNVYLTTFEVFIALKCQCLILT